MMPRIASYNIRKCIGLDWKRNPNRIQTVLAEINADVVLLQEADKRLHPRRGTLSAEQIYNELGYRFVEIADNQVSHGWHGNAILYREPFTLTAARQIEIPTTEFRGAVSAVLQLPNEKKLQIVGTHLSLLKKTRLKQIDFLAQCLCRQKRPYPLIIGGDFNEKKAEKWFAQNPSLQNFRLVTPGASFHSRKPLLKFDRFIVDKQIAVKDSSVHRSKLSLRASDHLPVIMDFCLP